MSIEEEYRRSTRGLGPLFLATLVMLAMLVLYLALRQRTEEAAATPPPSSMVTPHTANIA